jgi:hypothetical protein
MSYTIKVQPYTVQTHHGQCWRNASHWQCAVRVVEELIALADEMLNVLRANCDCGECGPCQLVKRAAAMLGDLDGRDNGSASSETL